MELKLESMHDALKTFVTTGHGIQLKTLQQNISNSCTKPL